jgi:hypothetical protein
MRQKTSYWVCMLRRSKPSMSSFPKTNSYFMRIKSSNSKHRLSTFKINKNISRASNYIPYKKTSTITSNQHYQTYTDTSNQSQSESSTKDTSTTKSKSMPISKDRNKHLITKGTNWRGISETMIVRSRRSILRLRRRCVSRNRGRFGGLRNLIKKLIRNWKGFNRKFMSLIQQSNKYAGKIWNWVKECLKSRPNKRPNSDKPKNIHKENKITKTYPAKISYHK